MVIAVAPENHPSLEGLLGPIQAGLARSPGLSPRCGHRHVVEGERRLQGHATDEGRGEAGSARPSLN